MFFFNCNSNIQINPDSIDEKTSVQEQKIVFKPNIGGTISRNIPYITFYFILITLFVVSAQSLIEEFSVSNVCAILIIINIGLSMFYVIKNNNKLVCIEGVEISDNKELTTRYAKKMGWSIDYNKKSHTVLSKPMTWPNNYNISVVIVIYDKEYIYFNCNTHTWRMANSPFHWFSNRKEEKIFKRDLLDKIYRIYR